MLPLPGRRVLYSCSVSEEYLAPVMRQQTEPEALLCAKVTGEPCVRLSVFGNQGI